ncbi:tyrosine-protein kinase family protein [Alteromonas sediminis]|uniref:Tyrosine-protein kinase family protein n=1 Tax=Alteromonas sediminis TaxID=2259342 RepID=A0A3N5Y5V0_9ALTE|nr:tyrosine-protein kinase family protein [Alteromonas sediminis]RPJ68586.1 tyrosine-protein kinase family protein [Alteromonas sediminis]
MYDPIHSIEIQRIYNFITSQQLRTLALTACNSQEGLSSLALALAQRHLLAGYNTLVVDLNLYRPSLQPLLNVQNDGEVDHLFPAPQLMMPEGKQIALTGVSPSAGRTPLMKLRSAGSLTEALKQWQTQFDLIIVDTSPLNRINANNIPAEQVAASCDGALLVVLSGQTSQAEVNEGIAKLNEAGAQLKGCILNDQYSPSLKTEMLREVNRLKQWSGWLGNLCQKVISNNRLLTLDV